MYSLDSIHINLTYKKGDVMHISLDSYRVFYYVALYRSFTRAAEILYSNQPNVTRAIKNLEQALGCSLFFRSSRSVRLTPEGEALFAHIRPAMEQIRSGEESVLLHSTLQSGAVSIGVSETALHTVLLPVLEQFRPAYPGIRLRILNSNSLQAFSALKENLVDLSVLTLPVEGASRYLCTELTRFRELPVCTPQLTASLAAPLSLSELAGLPLISLCRGSSTYQLYTDWFRAQGLTFTPDIEAATSDQLLPLIRAGLGVGFVPEQAARAAAEAGDVVILPLDRQLPERVIALLKRPDSPLSIAAGKLEEMILNRTIP